MHLPSNIEVGRVASKGRVIRLSVEISFDVSTLRLIRIRIFDIQIYS